MIALLDALGLDRVRLAGHDWGGFAGFLVCFAGPGAGLPLRRRRDEPPLGRAASRAIGAALQTAKRLAYMMLIASPVLGGQVVRRVPAFTRAVFQQSAADPDAPGRRRSSTSSSSQWSEPDRAAACVGIYRSFLTKELRQIASGGVRRPDGSRSPRSSSPASRIR